MTELSKAELTKQAEDLGVDVRASWTKDRLETEIVKARRSQPQQSEQVDPGSNDRLRRFTALDTAEKLGVAVGVDWSTEQIEQAVIVIQTAAEVAPPRYNNDGYDEFPDGAASPRG